MADPRRIENPRDRKWGRLPLYVLYIIIIPFVHLFCLGDDYISRESAPWPL